MVGLNVLDRCTTLRTSEYFEALQIDSIVNDVSLYNSFSTSLFVATVVVVGDATAIQVGELDHVVIIPDQFVGRGAEVFNVSMFVVYIINPGRDIAPCVSIAESIATGFVRVV